MITRFRLNEMKVNVNKFQLIIFNRQMTENVSINVDAYVIRNEHVIKLLGVYIDDLLNFDAHVDNICRKAGRKMNVLARLSGVFNVSYCYLIHLFYRSLNIVQLSGTDFCNRDKMRKIEKVQQRALRCFQLMLHGVA